MTINAFHPAYVRTHMPEFVSDLRVQSRLTKNGQALTQYIEKAREDKPSLGTVFGISKKEISVTPKTMLRLKPAKKMTMVEIHNDLVDIKKGKKK